MLMESLLAYMSMSITENSCEMKETRDNAKQALYSPQL